MGESSRIKTNEEWRKMYENDIEEWEVTINKVNKKAHIHIKKFYNGEGKLDLDGFLKGAKDITYEIFEQSGEKFLFGTIDNFKEFLKRGLKLYILDYNLDFDTSKRLRKSMGKFCYMYGELINYGELLSEDTKVYLEKNRNNKQKKEEIKELVERDYEIFFGEGTKGKTLNTKVGQATNEIIEVFTDGYYGSLDNKDNI